MSIECDLDIGLPQIIYVMKKVIFSMLLALVFVFVFANESETTCDVPANVSVSSQASGSISYDWDDCTGGCVEYEVWYVRLADNYRSSIRTATSSNTSFTGLLDGDYEFYFRTVCGGSVSSTIVIEDDIWN